jgi:penicillin-binding protein-related factor A (putative recombinase)
MWMEHNKTKTIPYEYIVNNCIHLPVIYPGIIDFLKYL